MSSVSLRFSHVSGPNHNTPHTVKSEFFGWLTQCENYNGCLTVETLCGHM